MRPMWAHSANIHGVRHPLGEHLRGTAVLARQFGDEIGAPDFSYAAGLLHDVGKLVEPWQAYLDAAEAGVQLGRVDHKTPGAVLLSRISSRPGWLICQGHHGGIPDNGFISDEELQLKDGFERETHELLPELAELLAQKSVVPADWVMWARTDPCAFEMAIRMVHSTLVDADFLDTAAHFNAAAPQVRPPADFRLLNQHFTERVQVMLAARTPAPVDVVREHLLEECKGAAVEPRGIFRLPAPTGSGKTISAAAFALAHAAHHGMRRVIVAVPFLSITEQNAVIYRRLVGQDHVIEHHSGLRPQADDRPPHRPRWDRRAKYGVENWDAPFVVTTTVQLFESLFSNRPSRTRKLHRLANSVIILDEIQAIPQHVLPVILDGLRILHKWFGTTVVLSSATQPTWHLLGPWREASGLEVRDIVTDAPRLYAGLRRSTVEWRDVPSLEEVADDVAAEPQVMMVVNTTSNARDLFGLVQDRAPEGTVHLSTRMHPAHRRSVLGEVRRRLASGLPVRLVTTQLVEAGVDLDFPVVFRAMAPAENLSQARGRCNREGLLPSGRFVVVRCPNLGELERAYATGIAKTRQHFRDGGDLDDPTLMSGYYADVYGSLNLDDQDIPRQIQEDRSRLKFKTVSDTFRMIEDDTVAVVVGKESAAALIIEELSQRLAEGGAPSPDRFRCLQDYTVNLPREALGKIRGYITEEIPGVLVWRGEYNSFTGVRMESSTPQDSVW